MVEAKGRLQVTVSESWVEKQTEPRLRKLQNVTINRVATILPGYFTFNMNHFELFSIQCSGQVRFREIRLFETSI